MDGNVYINYNEHEAFHHFMKIVTTKFSDPYKMLRMSNKNKDNSNYETKTKLNDGFSERDNVAYQVLSSSQLSFYRNDIVPEAKFSYDPSPIAVYYHVNHAKKMV